MADFPKRVTRLRADAPPWYPRDAKPASSVKKAKPNAKCVKKPTAGKTFSYQQINPKLPGCKAYIRYDKYKHATTEEEVLRLGGMRADIRYDLSKGFLTIMNSSTKSSDTSSRLAKQSSAEFDDPKARKEWQDFTATK